MNSEHPDRKQKIKHELREMLGLSLYLAFFFCAIEIYGMFLLNEYSVNYWNLSFALINALVVTKVIMIGEYAKLGRRYEKQVSPRFRCLEGVCIWPAGIRLPYCGGRDQTPDPWK